MSIKEIKCEELRGFEGREGLILQGCGGNLSEWLDGVNQDFEKKGILLENTKFSEENCLSFKQGEITYLLFEFKDNVKLDMGKLAMWRLSTHEVFGGTWLSDYVDNRLGGFLENNQENKKPDCPLLGADGNIFNLMGIASQTLRRNGMADKAKEMSEKIQNGAKSYDEALMIISEYVNITSANEDESEEMEMS